MIGDARRPVQHPAARMDAAPARAAGNWVIFSQRTQRRRQRPPPP